MPGERPTSPCQLDSQASRPIPEGPLILALQAPEDEEALLAFGLEEHPANSNPPAETRRSDARSEAHDVQAITAHLEGLSCLSCLLQHIVERASESQSAKEAEGKRCTRCAERTLLRNPLVLKREQRNKHTAVECPDAQSLTGCEGGEVPRENDANCRVLITLYLLPTRTKSPRKL